MKDRMAEAQRKREKTERNNKKKEQRLRYPFWPLLARGVDYTVTSVSFESRAIPKKQESRDKSVQSEGSKSGRRKSGLCEVRA